MDTLVIDGPIMKRVINTIVARIIKKKYGIDPRFTLHKLMIHTIDSTHPVEDMMTVSVKFTINKQVIDMVVNGLKEGE